ncbi:GrpB family protein [Amycolatopsis minnesotensis]|uniref:Dephospho-CoA kinase n=1 Tax=Amycolatopsis minnesotensis TaxID=337894 RepID=A0ABN2RL67_9PSEU
MKRVLLTGMSGTGKSTVVAELAARGYKAIDADHDGYSELVGVPDGELTGVGSGQDWVWREDAIAELLSTEDTDVLFVGGCSPNQGEFSFDHVVLLSAPARVIVERLTTRTTNSFGKDPGELARTLELQETIEPLLRDGADLELDTTAALDHTVEAVLRHVRESEPVVIVDYDDGWPALFDELRQPLAAALGTLTSRVEHVGSTSVPGLAAKPIIDMVIVLDSAVDLDEAAARIRPLGYERRGDSGVPGREAFSRPDGLPAHHLYASAADGEQLARQLAFRDALRASPEKARAYATLKRELARRFHTDRAGYTDAKTSFIESVLREITEGR